MMTLNTIRAAWLFLCLNLLALGVAAQQPLEVEVMVNQKRSRATMQESRLPLWQLGLEVARPVHQQFSDFSKWNSALPIELLGQLRLGHTGWYSQLYGGYFWGEKTYANGSLLQQRGFYVKPGLLFVVTEVSGRQLITLEGNLIASLGKLRGENSFYGPIFGDYRASGQLPVRSYGAELGMGSEVLQLGRYKVKLLARTGLVSNGGEENAFYIPGAGYVGSSFIRLTGGLNLYLIRAGEKPQAN
jgi:hypothetical protein